MNWNRDDEQTELAIRYVNETKVNKFIGFKRINDSNDGVV